MSRSVRLFTGIISAAVLAGAVIGGVTPADAQQAAAPAYAPVANSVVPFTSHAAATGSVPGPTRLSIQVWLKPNVTAAQAYAAAVSTPGSAQYRRYLSPASYTASFGPTAAVTTAVASWLRSQGFTGISGGPGRAYIRATAPVSAINGAFHTSVKYYRPPADVSANGHALRANSGTLSVPAPLSGSVLGVTGLDNAAPVAPAAASPTTPGCSAYYGQHMATRWPKRFGTTSFPSAVCGYSAAQLRAAYGADTASTGKGQRIALVEWGLTPDMFLTLKDYAAANKLPAPSAQRYTELSLGRGDACGDPFADEEELDVEAAYAMAPGASQLVVGGDSCDTADGGIQGVLNADLAVVDGSGGHPLASIVSNSWGNPLAEAQDAAVTSIEHAYLVQAAAEGVGMYFSTGDASGISTPATDPYATSVGGTTLGIGKTGNRLFETGWSTGLYLLSTDDKSWVDNGEMGAAGGGLSLAWSQPAYQRGVVPEAFATPPGDRGGPVRVTPDISADADPMTGMAVGEVSRDINNKPTYGQTKMGGTSLAVPLVAGLVADAQQGQSQPFGFLNPGLYQLAGTTALHDGLPLTSASPALWRGVWCPATDYLCENGPGNPVLAVFDDQDTTLEGYTGQVTLKGYDTMTGLGTPNGQAFITALRALREEE